MQSSCSTRAVKVLKYLHCMVPATIPRSSLHALEKLPANRLSDIHTMSDWSESPEIAPLKTWLANNPVPSPTAFASSPLLNGTLVFVQLIFQQPNQPASSMSSADVQTAVNYANLAIQPIQWYASQYGQPNISVSPTVIPFTADLTGASFTVQEFEGWVDQCATIARNNNVSNPCIVILHNRDLPNSGVFSGQRDSHHSMTGTGVAYCYSLVFGENLSVSDNNHTINGKPNDKVYAHNLSHEIAEMVVDPGGSIHNREVCDACAGNCNNSLFDLFDVSGAFLGGTAGTATANGFAFFINSIVSASVGLDSNSCVVPGADPQGACVYPPPLVTGQLLSYGDAGAPGNVSGPAVVGFGGWQDLPSLFSGRNQAGENRIYAVNQQSQLLSYADSGTLGNVSGAALVGFGGWLQFKFLFSGANQAGENRIYAVVA